MENNMKKISDFSREEIENAVKKSSTFKDALRYLGYFGYGGAYRTFRKRIENENIDFSHMAHYKSNPKKRDRRTIFCKDCEVSSNVLRRAVLEENITPYECSICGNKGEWMGKPLSLTLEHINGDHRDNTPSNLRFLCPNCDRQTDTFGSKNKRSYYKTSPRNKQKVIHTCPICGKEISRDGALCVNCRKNESRKHFPAKNELLIAIKECSSLVALGRYFKVSDNAMRKRLKYYGIPYRSKEYREYRKSIIIAK